jgi:hypothetical protein
MPNEYSRHAHIDSEHCRAICDEIGYRLRSILERDVPKLPAYLLQLLSRLEDQEACMQAPSIVPSIEDMHWQPTAHFCKEVA